MVNSSGNNFLAGSTLAADQDCREDASHFADNFVDPLHLLAVPDQPVNTLYRNQFARRTQVAGQHHSAVSAIQGGLQCPDIKRLEEEVPYTLSHGLHRALTPRIPTEPQHRG